MKSLKAIVIMVKEGSMKHLKTIAIVALAGGVLLASAAVGLAQTPTATPAPTPALTATPTPGLLPRVAAILGIEEQKLKDAFAQARAETRQVRLDKWAERQIQGQLSRDKDKAYTTDKLDKAVKEGRITDEQKGKILERGEKGQRFGPRGFGRGGGHRMGMGGHPGGWR